MSEIVLCYACQANFPLDPEALRDYRDGLIQGQRVPRYWIRCPVCGQKNVIELTGATDVIPGKPSAR